VKPAPKIIKTTFSVLVIFLALLGTLGLSAAFGLMRGADEAYTYFEQHLPAISDNDLSEMISRKTIQERYLDLLKKYLVRYDFNRYILPETPINTWLESHHLAMIFFVRKQLANTFSVSGIGMPDEAETMISLRRLDNIEYCIKDVLKRHVPGDLIEAGVWRGGATIFMRGVLEAYGNTDRRVWVADSFQGLPKPDTAAFPIDLNFQRSQGTFAASLDTVKGNFARYGLLDDQVRFLPGWFRNTLPHAPIGHLAVLRIDADLYESTMEALRDLYPKVSPGGYILIDDYRILPETKKAVDNFRASEKITSEIKYVDWDGAYWQKTK